MFDNLYHDEQIGVRIGDMGMETLINLSTLVALVAGLIGLYVSLRRPIDRLETSMNARFEKVDERFNKVDERFDRLERDLSEFRLETREVLARHDERIGSLERQRPQLLSR